MMKEYFTFAGQNVKRRKLRSWLTVVGIVISIATIFVLVSVSLGLSEGVQEQFRQLGTDKFFIQPKGQLGGPGTGSAAQLTSDDIDVIKKTSGVKDYSYWSVGSAKIEFQNQVRFVNVIGIPMKYAAVFTESGFINPEQGQILTTADTNKIMIGSQYAHNDVFKKSLKVGDTLTINGKNFRIKAVLKSVGNPSDDKVIYMPLQDFEELFPAKKDNYDQIAVQIQSGENIDAVAKRVEKALTNAHGLTEKTEDFTILTPEQLLATFGTVLNILTGFLLGVAAISLLVGGIGITNTMYTAVLERTKEIGVMKAVGATNFDIIAFFTVESGLIGAIGGLGGIIIGYGVGKIIEAIVVQGLGISILKISTPWYLFLGSILFSFLVGAIAGLVPAYRASRIRPVEALRYE